MSATEPIPMENYQEAAMVLEAQERDTAEAWGRISALARMAIASVRAREPLSAEAERMIESDFALLNAALGFNAQRSRWD